MQKLPWSARIVSALANTKHRFTKTQIPFILIAIFILLTISQLAAAPIATGQSQDEDGTSQIFLPFLAETTTETIDQSAVAAGTTAPFLIDGTVPDSGAIQFADPFGSAKELGPANSNTNKLGQIHNSPLPMLDFTDPAGKSDFTNIWLDIAKDTDGDQWLYFAWERDSTSGSTVVAYEFQQAAAPTACNYAGVDQEEPPSGTPTAAQQNLIDNCNPWSGRQAGDFMIVFDFSGSTIDIGLRTWNGSTWSATMALGSYASGALNSTESRGEGSLNLTQTIFSGLSSCLSIANILPGTLTGNSDSADYKDTVLANFSSAITVSNCGAVRVTKQTDPVGGTGSFPYTLSQADGGTVDYNGNTSRTGTLTQDGDSNLVINLLPDTDYQLTEGPLSSDWTLQSIICGGTDITAGGTFPVIIGETTNCTITNKANNGSLKLVKIVDNLGESGAGYLGVGNFPLTIDGNPTTSGNAVTVNAGAHTIGETSQSGYTVGQWLCTDDSSGSTVATGTAGAVTTNVTINGGQNVTCEITNTLVATPALTLVKTASPTIYDAVDDVISYSYLVTNNGNVTLAGPVTVTDDKTNVTCPLGDLTPGASTTCTATYVITQADLDAGSVTNVASATAANNGNPVTSPTDTATVDAVGLSLLKSLLSNADEDNSNSVTVNDTLTYQFVATNDGNVTLTGVTIVDPMPGLSTLSCTPSVTLAPAETLNCTATYVVTQADVDAGVINNTATADSDQTEPTTGSETVLIEPMPVLSLVKSLLSNADEDNSNSVTVNDTLTYQFVATNDGNVTLTGVTIVDPMPGLSTLSCTPSTPSVTLAPAETLNCTATYIVTQADVDAGRIDNTATADSDQTEPTTGSETVLIEPMPVLSLVKSFLSNVDEDNSGSVTVNDTLTYQFVATNEGNVTLTGVTIVDPMPGLSTLSCTPSTPSVTLAPAETLNCTATYIVTQADVDAGRIDNTATADSDQTDSVVDQETVDIPQSPKLNVDKVFTNNADEDNSGTITVNDTLTYRITATNDGNVTLNNVVVSDDLTGDSTTCVTVAPSNTCVLTVTYVVQQADANAGRVTNIGTADSDETAPVDDPETVSVIQADLSLTKTVNDAQPSVGQSVIFTISVANAGPSTATNVAVADVVPDGYLNITSISNGGTVNGNMVTWNGLTIAANNSVDLTFAATVNVPEGNADEYLNVAQVTASDQYDPDSTPNNNVATEDDQDSASVTPRGNILIAKTTTGGDGTFDFDTSLDADSAADFFITTNNGTGEELTALTNLVPGSYTITELVPDGWELTEAHCLDRTNPLGRSADPTVVVDLKPGQTVQCYFDNTKLGKITIAKRTDGDVGSFTFGGDLNGGNDFSLTTTAVNSTVERTFINLSPGTYSIQEQVPAGWSLTGLRCSDRHDVNADAYHAAGTLDINLTAGESITCTFDNTKHGSITVAKTLTDAAGRDRDFDFTSASLGNNSFTLSTSNGSASTTFGDLLPGTYDASEVIPSGWQLTDLICTGDDQSEVEIGNNGTFDAGDTGFSVTLAAGEDLSCTFTNDPLPTASVDKRAVTTALQEPGGPATFEVTVNNLSSSEALDLTSLTDDPYGTITAVGGAVTATTCTVPRTIAAGGSYSCQFTVNLQGQPGQYTDTVTATLSDNEENEIRRSDSATVTMIDIGANAAVSKDPTPSTLPEPGGPVTFDIVITSLNTREDLTLSALVDDPFGDVTAVGGDITATTCAVPQTIAPGGTYTCAFTVDLTGQPGVYADTITATISDNDGNEVTPTADAEVTITDVAGALQVIKSANPAAVPEVGGTVTFTVDIRNLSTVDAVTLETINDDVYGAVCPSLIGVTLAPGATRSCEFTRFITGQAGDVHTNVVTVSGTDDDGAPVSDNDDANVTINDTPATLHVHKQADVSEVSEPGDDVTFTVVVENQSTVDQITLETVIDDQFGDISASCTPALPVLLDIGESTTCRFTERIEGNAGDMHINVVTATGIDDDGNTVQATDSEEVLIDNVISSVKVLKLANPTSVSEPGGTVTYTLRVTNTSAVDIITLQTLVDDQFGDLTAECAIPATGIRLTAGATFDCTFTGFVSGNAGDIHTNVVTVSAVDDDDNDISDSDTEQVDILDLPSALSVIKVADRATVPESGAPVTFTVTVQNVSLVDTVTVEHIEDDQFGAISNSCTPALPATLAPGETVSCQFTEQIDGAVGSVHRNVVTAEGTDDDGNSVSANDDAEVEIVDVPSSLAVTKRATPTTVPEGGGTVTFTVSVENTSPVDAVLITQFTDDQFGDLHNRCGITVWPMTLAPGARLDCTFTEFIDGTVGSVHRNVVTATGTDDDGNPISANDDAEVEILDTAPSILVEKRAAPTTLPESGGPVTFTVTVLNQSVAEPVTLTTLQDTVYGDLDGRGSCVLPQTLAADGGVYTCSFSVILMGNVGEDHRNVVTATVSDDDGNQTTDSDDAEVTFDDLLPSLEVIKLATPETVLASSGAVTYTIQVLNTGQEAVTLTSLVDDRFGALNGVGTCVMPQTIGIGENYACTFTKVIAGTSGTAHINVVTVTGNDDEGNVVTDEDNASVAFGPVQPILELSKEVELLVDTFDRPKDAGKITPGDTLRYYLTLVNRGNGIADGVLIEDTPDGRTALIVGSVVTSKGTVLEGNSEGDTKIVVQVGSVAPNRAETITVYFDVVIDPDTKSTILSNQAEVIAVGGTDGETITSPSDDPTTPKEDDPTLVEVIQIPTALPGAEEPGGPRVHAIFLPLVTR